MRSRTAIALAALPTVGVLVVGGCAAEDAGTADAGSSTGQGRSAVDVEVTIEDGSVRPLGEQVEVGVDQTVRLHVDSDAADHLHVHSDPEHEFAVEPGMHKAFSFRVSTPGQVDVELHELGATVVQLVVRP